MSRPYDLKINLLSQPYGVPADQMTFSFFMENEGEGTLLQAVRVSVAASLSAWEKQDYLFDSGFFAADNNCGISVDGLSQVLNDDQLYVCAIQTQTNYGESEWSAPLYFSTAPKAWNPCGVWAATPCDFCFLRKEVSLAELPVKALLQVTARSPEPIRQYVYHVTCNGEFVGLGPARYGKQGEQIELYYETIDITHALQEGVNCLGFACYTTSDHLFAARLTVFDAAGQKTVVFDNASSFEGMNATEVFRPEQSIGTNYFFAHAENIDGQRFPYGWDSPAYKGEFAPVADKGDLLDESMVLKPYPAPIVKRDQMSAQRYEIQEDGSLLVDLGKEIIGGIALTADLAQACDVTLRFGEELTPEGRVKYAMRTTNVYEEHWHLAAGKHTLSEIGMKTFRYIEIVGCPPEADITVVGNAYCTEFDQNAAYFTSSSELLNTIYDLCQYTIKATNQNLYVDSQSRERCAYEGDVLINMLTAAGVQDCHALSRWSIDYLLTHRTWPAEYVLYCILMARADYEYTGDATLLQQCYQLFKQNLYWQHYDPQVGLVRNITMAGNVMDAVLVDWPMSERDGYEYNRAIYNTVLNSVHYRALADLAYLANVLGIQEDAEHYQQLADTLKTAMIEKLYDEQRGCFVDGLTDQGEPLIHAAQHATAFALYAGVYDSVVMQQAMAKYLADQGEIRMSVYGAHFLLEGLYQAAVGAAANKLLLSDDVSEGARTWAYMLDKLDATVTTEAWNVINKPNMTWSHPWGSAAGAAIVRGVFGIRPLEPGFKEFSVDLQTEGLRYGAIKAPTVKGPITVSFNTTEENCAMSVNLTVPANALARLSIPAPTEHTVTVNGKAIEAICQNGRYGCCLGSGQWLVEIK